MLADVAREQAGVVTRAQALASGLTAKQIEVRLRSGHWQRLHRGVYATFSGVVPREAQLWAAVLAGGPDAMLSHRSAAEVAGLCAPDSSAIHITVPSRRQVTRTTGIALHRSGHTERARHPAKTPPQTRVEETVLDLTQVARTMREVEGWVIRACAQQLTRPDKIRESLLQRKKVRHRVPLLALLSEVDDGCHSLLELAFLRTVERRHWLPPGTRQHQRSRPGGSYYDDVCYEPYFVIVELDGSAAHAAEDRSRDRRRDNAAAAAGYTVLRFGTADVLDDPCGVTEQLVRVLRLNGWRGQPRACGPTCMITQTFTPVQG